VFQIATHKRIVPLEQLYAWCETARGLLQGEHAVGRVIARPFDGPPGAFARTTERRDYALPPAGPTVLEALQDSGVRTCGVGKIEDIFSRQGLVASDHTGDNDTSMDATLRFLRDSDGATLVFTNLVDFDMLYGHRRDAVGYARCLERLDARLPELVAELGVHDWLLLTADHGCDPTAPGSDHTRELTPLVAFSPGGTAGELLDDRDSFADLGATVADLFGAPWTGPGRSFADRLVG
jgi:phosphopentomutase